MIIKFLKNSSNLFIIGSLIFILLVLAMIFIPIISNEDPYEGNIATRLTPPGMHGHLLGTDSVGRDILTRMFVGLRLTFFISLISVTIAFVLGSTLGLIAGFYGGIIDKVIAGFTEIQAGFPFIILAVTILTLVPSTIPMIILVLVLSSWISFARVVRSKVIDIKTNTFIYSAYSLGASDFWIIKNILAKMILPKTIVSATLDLAYIIILSAILGLLGLGVMPPTPTIGGMMADGKKYITNAWWLTTIPGGILFIFTFSLNLIGQGALEMLED